MTFRIDIFDNFDQVAELYERYSPNILVPSVRNSLNKTILFSRKSTIKRFRSTLNVKRRDLITMTKIHKVKGNSIDRMVARLDIANEPMPLLWFVKGSKEPENQKGKSIKRRRKIKIRVRKNKTSNVRGAFIQKAKTVQLFRRNIKGGGFNKQSTPRLLKFFNEKPFNQHIKRRTISFFVKTFQRDILFRENKEWAKINDVG